MVIYGNNSVANGGMVWETFACLAMKKVERGES